VQALSESSKGDMEDAANIEILFEAQIELMTRLWGQAIERHYPDSLPDWRDPARHLALMNVTLLKAVKKVEWSQFLKKSGTTVLDVGAGTGWLSALLSMYECVTRVDALDSDRDNLQVMLPQITDLLGGSRQKIKLLLGLMDPLPLPDESYDLIVASSSIHHTPNLFSALVGLRRLLRRDGVLLLLNETPRTFDEYLNYSLHIIYLILERVGSRTSTEFQETLSANGILYDPKLGDTAFAFFQYANALTNAGLKYGIIRSGVYTGPVELVHFVCARSDGDHDIRKMGAAEISPSDLEVASQETLARVAAVMTAAVG
jgi:ubiquinone/menaquinone biosynthesis C-methylase UbiE